MSRGRPIDPLNPRAALHSEYHQLLEFLEEMSQTYLDWTMQIKKCDDFRAYVVRLKPHTEVDGRNGMPFELIPPSLT